MTKTITLKKNAVVETLDGSTVDSSSPPWTVNTDTPVVADSPVVDALLPVGLEGVAMEFPEVLEQGSITKAMTGATKGIVWKAPRDLINIYPGLNVRAETAEYTAHCEAIGRSMFAEGWYDDKPLGGFVGPDGKVYVKDGHSRLRGYDFALTLGAQIEYIPIVVSAGKDFSIQDITIGLVKSNEGRPLQPIEKAVVCRRLSKWGWDSARIGERLDMTGRYVDELIALLGSPAALVALVQEGKVSASTAMQEIKTKGAAKAAETIVAAAKTAKGGKVTAKTIKKAAGVTPPAAKKAPTVKAKGDPVHDPMDVLRAVFNDPGFNKLADAVQQMVLSVAT